MAKFKKAVLGAAVAMALSASALAAPINVGGVIWDPDAGIDFNSGSASPEVIQSFTGSIAGGDLAISGYGRISAVNGTPQSTFCPGCELTFVFGGFTQSDSNEGPNLDVYYTGGFVKLFVDNTPDTPVDFSTATLAQASDGDLWLDLVATPGISALYPSATLKTTISPNPFPTQAVGGGLLNVTALGGLAKGNFDTNTQPFPTGGADVSFSTTFTSAAQSFKFGSGTFTSNTIPEPGSIALLGVGLLGLAAMRRRKA